MRTLSERLDRAMKLRNLNGPQLAELAGMSRSNVHYLLDGTTQAEKVRAVTIDALAAALKVNRDWLLYGEGPMEGARPGVGVSVSYVARLDRAIVAPAVKMAQSMVGKEAVFDPCGDVPLFIAAYELMADATVENRASFDTALTQRVVTAINRGQLEHSPDTARRAGKRT